MEALTYMNTDDKHLQSAKLKSAAQLIADDIRDGELLADEPYGWGLTMADMAKQVYDLLKDKFPGREEWAHNAMRAGLRSEHKF
jgi:hypothetical protein